MHLAKRAAHGAEVLRKGKYGAAVDHAVARHDALAGDFRLVHAEVYAAMFDELVHFHEDALVEETGQPLAGRQSPRGLHLLEGLLTAAEFDLLLRALIISIFSLFVTACHLFLSSIGFLRGTPSLSSSSTPPVDRGCTKRSLRRRRHSEASRR